MVWCAKKLLTLVCVPCHKPLHHYPFVSSPPYHRANTRPPPRLRYASWCMVVLDTCNKRRRVNSLFEILVFKMVLKLRAPVPWYMGMANYTAHAEDDGRKRRCWAVRAIGCVLQEWIEGIASRQHRWDFVMAVTHLVCSSS